jgi:hypothetical protein
LLRFSELQMLRRLCLFVRGVVVVVVGVAAALSLEAADDDGVVGTAATVRHMRGHHFYQPSLLLTFRRFDSLRLGRLERGLLFRSGLQALHVLRRESSQRARA